MGEEKRKQVQGGYSHSSWKESLERNREKREVGEKQIAPPHHLIPASPFRWAPPSYETGLKDIKTKEMG